MYSTVDILFDLSRRLGVEPHSPSPREQARKRYPALLIVPVGVIVKFYSSPTLNIKGLKIGLNIQLHLGRVHGLGYIY